MENNKMLSSKILVIPKLVKFLLENFKPDVNLKTSEIKTLMVIHMQKHKPMNFYSEKIDLQKGSFTYLVDKLENKGLLKREESKEDRRKKVLTLTEDGEKIAENITEQFIKYLGEKINILTDNDKERLFEALNVIDDIFTLLKKECN